MRIANNVRQAHKKARKKARHLLRLHGKRLVILLACLGVVAFVFGIEEIGHIGAWIAIETFASGVIDYEF